MKLKHLGFFQELSHGDPNGPALKNLINTVPHVKEPEVVKYLRNGKLFIGCPGLVNDVLKKDSAPIGSPNILTDGVWAWPGDLPYYLQHYHVKLPEEFLEHVEQAGFRISDNIDVRKLEL